MAKLITLLTLQSTLLLTIAYSQPVNLGDLGNLLVKTYSPDDYAGHIQNWDAVQDHDGIMYFANGSFVLQYDGANWVRTPMSNNSVPRSLALGADSLVYVGAQNDFGYLASDSLGKPFIKSLIAEVPSDYQNFGNVWRTYSISMGVYFITEQYLFFWDGNAMTTWKSDYRFSHSICLGDQLYVFDIKHGIKTISGDSLVMAKGGEEFAQNEIVSLLPFEEDGQSGLLVLTEQEAFYKYDKTSRKPFPTAIDDILLKYYITRSTRLPDGNYALAALNHGLVIINPQGQLVHLLNRENGLPSLAIACIYPDDHNGVWLGTFNGIVRFSYPSQFTVFEENTGLRGAGLSITRHNNSLYVGTNVGLFVLDQNAQIEDRFRNVPGVASAFSMAALEDRIVVAGSGVIHQVVDGEATVFHNLDAEIFALTRSSRNPDMLFVGSSQGVGIIKRNAGRWDKNGFIQGIENEIRKIVEDAEGRLWLQTRTEGLIMVELDPENDLKPIRIERFDETLGLPSSARNALTKVNGEAMAGTTSGLRHYDDSKNVFQYDSEITASHIDSTYQVHRLEEGSEGVLWVFTVDPNSAFDSGKLSMGTPTSGNTYNWTDAPFRQLPKSMTIHAIYPDTDGIVWFGGTKGLWRFDQKVAMDAGSSSNPIIQKVAAGGDEIPSNVTYRGVKLSYENNALAFSFSLPHFESEQENQFTSYLEGFDQDWSDWSQRTEKSYTNLPEGNYVFRVKGQDLFGHIGKEATYPFSILPPWYRTWWSYLGYLAMLIAGIQLVVQWRSKQLRKEKETLEATIAERTREIEVKNSLLEEQAEKLKQMDKVKSSFFANISHEFRTPLTLIQGPLKAVESGDQEKLTERHISVMNASANRLLRLVNQLLDLSKLESGGLKLEASERDIVFFLRGLSLSFETLAIENHIDLSVASDRKEVLVFFDWDKLEKIFFNLMSNAFKFTEPGGKIDVNIHDEDDYVSVSIKDTGVGIDQDQLPYVFDRFYQADGATTKLQAGSGIGLALTKELVELHHGEITVESTLGVGTEFQVKLKKGRDHLSDEQIFTSINDLPDLRVDMFDVHPEAETHELEDAQWLVLVVEDNPDVRAFIREQLITTFKIKEAENGVSGLKAAKELIPDLVISDVMMPEMDGFQLTNELKQDVITSHIPVIMLTAKADTSDKIEGFKTGADDYLTKPFDGKELIARIDNLIKSRHQLREQFRKEIMLEPQKISIKSMDEKFLSEVIVAIEDSIADQQFSVEKLSDLMAMSRIHLHRKLKALTGHSASRFIRTIRLKRARQLIEQKAATITEIAYQVGFNNISYFAKCFKEEFGILPSEWK